MVLELLRRAAYIRIVLRELLAKACRTGGTCMFCSRSSAWN